MFLCEGATSLVRLAVARLPEQEAWATTAPNRHNQPASLRIHSSHVHVTRSN